METKTRKQPKKASKKNRVHHTMRIKPEILERIKVRADEEGRPVNNLIERVLDLNV